MVVRDVTEVEESTAAERLVLTASGRPFGKARIDIVLTPQSDGCRVAITETPVSGPGAWIHNPVLDLAIARRNVETLARLAAVAERPTSSAD